MNGMVQGMRTCFELIHEDVRSFFCHDCLRAGVTRRHGVRDELYAGGGTCDEPCRNSVVRLSLCRVLSNRPTPGSYVA